MYQEKNLFLHGLVISSKYITSDLERVTPSLYECRLLNGGVGLLLASPTVCAGKSDLTSARCFGLLFGIFSGTKSRCGPAIVSCKLNLSFTFALSLFTRRFTASACFLVSEDVMFLKSRSSGLISLLSEIEITDVTKLERRFSGSM